MVKEESASEPASGPMGRFALEALERLATPEVAREILREALASAGLDVVPEIRAEFGSFACGALEETVADTLGSEAAEAVLVDLQPAFTITLPSGESTPPSSGVRARGRESLTRPAAAERVVLVASHDRSLVQRLLPSFGEDTKVSAAYDIFGLLQSSQRYLTSPLILILHDEMPSIRPASLGTLARVLPPSTKIVQFGKGRVEPLRGKNKSLPDIKWIRLGDAPIHEVLEAVGELLPTVQVREEPSRRIVLAHGEAAIRTEIAARLRNAGHEVIETSTGFEALDSCIDELPAMIMTARDVPALDGFQLAALLVTRFGPDAPDVVIVGGDPSNEERPTGVTEIVGEGDLDGLLRLAKQS